MISVIICSINTVLLAQLKTNVENTINVEHEIIVVNNKNNAYSIAAAYNYGASQAKYPYLCFCHEDVGFYSINWGEKLITYLSDIEIGLIGVVGSIIKTAAPSGVWFNNRHSDRYFMLQGNTNASSYIKYANPLGEKISEVKVIDGLFMCCRKDVWEENKFDEITFTDFHGYDLDFSLQIQKKYKLYVVYDIELEHLSNGGNTIKWIDNMFKITKKWKDVLPVYTNKFEVSNLNLTEYKAYDYFSRSLIDSGYRSYFVLILIIKLFLIDPFNLNNLRLTKYFIKNGKY